ncbi:MAG: ABC transporter ATP-binding protein [Notoacmeibacter sp.]|nr:ABC transporter ATP-binding protein [Notoacmeibacter sp.]
MKQTNLKIVSDAQASGSARSARPVIEIKGVSKTYKTQDGEVPSLRPLDFDINEGEFLVVVGPSGCGKSTLLKLIAGLLPPSAGEIRVENRVVTSPHRDVGIVFQSALLLPWRRVLENVMMPVEVKGLPIEEYRRRALDLIKMVGLDGFERKYPWQLSGGMQQRAAICRALVHDPKIVLMDEPFGALDEIVRDHLNEQLLELWARTDKTICFVTHSIPEAVYLSTKIVVMSPRPGRVTDVIESTLPKERPLDIRETEEFLAIAHRVREGLRAGHSYDE